MTDRRRQTRARPRRTAIALVLALSLGVAACETTAPSPTAPLVQESSPPASAPATVATGTPAPSPVVTPSPAASPSTAPAAIDPANFTTTIDNPWFPLIPGWTYTYEGTEDGDRLFETFEVTTETKVVDGVTCVVIRDLLKVNGILEERTSDYYVQDLQGDVWYFGEDTAELDEQGHVTNTEGTWTAGVDGAQPGIFMPANPTVGYAGEQEIYPGTAEDRFVVLLSTATVKVPYGSFSNALVTLEWTILEPGVLSEKQYARGVGQVKEFDVKGGSETLSLTKLVKP
jgi:hypothetical protein